MSKGNSNRSKSYETCTVLVMPGDTVEDTKLTALGGLLDSVVSDVAPEASAWLGCNVLTAKLTTAFEVRLKVIIDTFRVRVDTHVHRNLTTELRDGFVVSVTIDGCRARGGSDCSGSCLTCHAAIIDNSSTVGLEAGTALALELIACEKGVSGLG